MKRFIISAMFLILAVSLTNARPRPASVTISFGSFYSSLQPYGEWIEIDADVFAWRPNSVNWDWRPYSLGRWAWTRHGWYWDSYEPFGWATYHYGRWYNDDYYGWIWIPDYEWGPSWVEWRYDDDYIGWAPLPPYASFRIHFGIHFSIRWHSHYNYWNFVPYRRFCDYRVGHYIIDSRRSRRIFERTKYRTNYYMDRDRLVNGGVDRSFIERKAGYRIAERDIHVTDNYRTMDRSKRSRNEGIYSYRPSDRDNSRSVERYDIKRGEKRTSLERDKIITPRESNREINRNRDKEIFENNRKENRNEPRKEINRDRDQSNNERREMRNNNREVRPNESRREPDMNRSREEKSERKRETRVERERPQEHKSSPRSTEKRENRSDNRSRSERRR